MLVRSGRVSSSEIKSAYLFMVRYKWFNCTELWVTSQLNGSVGLTGNLMVYRTEGKLRRVDGILGGRGDMSVSPPQLAAV